MTVTVTVTCDLCGHAAAYSGGRVPPGKDAVQVSGGPEPIDEVFRGDACTTCINGLRQALRNASEDYIRGRKR